MFWSSSHCLFSPHRDLSFTHPLHCLLLYAFVLDNTQKNSIKPKAIVDKTWIAVGSSLGISLATVTIIMIIYFWKFRNQKGISKIFLELFVLRQWPNLTCSKYSSSHIFKYIKIKNKLNCTCILQGLWLHLFELLFVKRMCLEISVEH